MSAQGFDEGKGKPFSAQEVRFTQKGNILYAIVLGAPTKEVSITSMGKTAGLLKQSIEKIQLLGSKEKINWQQTDEALLIAQPKNEPNNFAVVFKITLRGR